MPHKRGLSIRQNSSAEGLNHLIRIHVICIACNNVKASSGTAAEVYLWFTAADLSPSCPSAAAICWVGGRSLIVFVTDADGLLFRFIADLLHDFLCLPVNGGECTLLQKWQPKPMFTSQIKAITELTNVSNERPKWVQVNTVTDWN